MVWEVFLGAFLQVLFDRLASRQLLDFFKRRELNQNILERLNITLLTINSLVTDAEEKQIVNPFVKKWVDEIKDAIYHAEDVLDEIATEALRCNVEAESSANRLKQLRGKISLGDWLDRNCEDLESKLERVTLRLERLAVQRNVLGLKEVKGVKPIGRLPSTSLVDESAVFGRDRNKEEIMRFLLLGNGNGTGLQVVAIVGVGGIGKTTLAQILYNDPMVQRRFDTKAWAYVSEEFDVSKITKTVYESVTSRPSEFTDLNVLQVKLKQKLTNKRFLLVLDDLRSENFVDWDLLRRPFEGAAAGSRIIVTTRSQRVATVMRAAHSHALQPLSDGDCWLVFMKHAFGDQEPCLDRKLGGFAEKIVKKCHGLPLAAKTLGGLLLFERQGEEWERILNSKIWELPVDKSNILPVLQVSYHYLPAHLKQCFAYCSIFPKGYAFEKEKLVLLWMAEGFLPRTKQKKRLEALGDEYFSELVSRSLFQSINKSQFSMHDLINELSQFAAGEFCFKYESGNQQQAISEKTRHFAYVRDQYGETAKFEGLRVAKFLRTFLPLSLTNSCRSCFLDKIVGDKLLPGLSCLRVLSLSNYKIATIPSEFFTNLRHVRYLDLSHTEIKKLPKSLCSLYNLETLVLSYCPNLNELPADICNLVNLRLLDLIGTKLAEMPRKFGRLKSLQTLSIFVISAGTGAKISELGNLLELHGKLSISELHRVAETSDAKGADLESKKNIKDIAFIWRTKATILDKRTSPKILEQETDVFDQLRPHENIEKITIEKFGGRRFPGWLGDASFSNISLIRLSECQNCISMPPLGQLPRLEELHISKMRGLRSIGPEFCFGCSGQRQDEQQPFKSLHTLRFDDMPDWEEWTYEMPDWKDWTYAKTSYVLFPSLQKLYLTKCPRLVRNLPTHLPSLVSLHIQGCGGLDFQPKKQEYMYRELKRLSIRTSCNSLITFPLGFFDNLEELEIQDCISLHSFEILNEHQDGVLSLRKMTVSHCHELVGFPAKAFLPPELQPSIMNCRRFRPSPEQLPNFHPSLPRLNLSNSPEFGSSSVKFD